jgi:hypothetical protein
MSPLRIAAAAALLVACGGTAPVVAPTNQDTLEAHARAQDDEGLKRASLALDGKSKDERMKALAAVLEYEPRKLVPLVAKISERATKGDDDAEKAAAIWALVHAEDVRVASAALLAWDSGALAKVKKLDGSAALDLGALARLVAQATVPEEQAARRRKVIAAALPSVAAPARAMLVRALTDDAADAATLLAVTDVLDARRDFGILEHIFARLHELADPRLVDALAKYADHATHPHFRTEAALRLAELGDLRAAPHLAWRLGEDPTKLYDASDETTIALRRDDRERVVCARMLAELALLHPEAHAQLRETAEAQTLAWLKSHPQPHANGLRALVAMESREAVPLLKRLADPPDALPVAGATAFPEAFATAQTALRYLGKTKDAAAFAVLEKQLDRKPAAFDASMDSLMKGGLAVAGMTYRSLAWGAAEGFSELGDVKAVPLLVKIAEDGKQNESARVEACKAAGWLGDAHARAEMVAKVRAAATDRKREIVRACWLEALAQKPSAHEDAPLASLLAPKVVPESRHEVARILGEGALDAPTRTKLVDLLKDKTLVHDAALALLFGGDDATLASVFQAYTPAAEEDAPPPPSISSLRQLYALSVPVVTEELYESGALAKMARNALAARAITIAGAKQEWVLQGLSYQLRQNELDNGPHTLTRVRWRARLALDAKGQDARKRDDAVLLLWVLGEHATLESLGDVAKARLAETLP